MSSRDRFSYVNGTAKVYIEESFIGVVTSWEGEKRDEAWVVPPRVHIRLADGTSQEFYGDQAERFMKWYLALE